MTSPNSSCSPCCPKLDSNEVARVFTEKILTLYGRPLRVRTDNGSEFKGAFEALVEEAGVQHIFTAPLAPWTNGVAERMVVFCKKLIKKALVGHPKQEWPTLVPWIQGVINSSVSRATSLSPHEIFFGEPPAPFTPTELAACP